MQSYNTPFARVDTPQKTQGQKVEKQAGAVTTESVLALPEYTFSETEDTSTVLASNPSMTMKEMLANTSAYNTHLNFAARDRAHTANCAWIRNSRATAAYDSEADAECETDDELPAVPEKREADALSSVKDKAACITNENKTVRKRGRPARTGRKGVNKPDEKREITFVELEDGDASEGGSEEEVEYVPRPTRSRGVRKPADV